MIALTRAAALTDFPACPSIHAWQQAHAIDAYSRWRTQKFLPTLKDSGRAVVYNWGAASFAAPWSILPTDYYDHRDWPHFLGDQTAGAIYACSVLDRVEEPRRFLRQAHAALVGGGLLVATFALWDASGPDVAIGHELRSRIYDRLTWARLIDDVRGIGYQTFGGVNLKYRGDTLDDHSLGSIVLVKELDA
jgi:hypothetical protein